uniref:Uncharacterized protein n=1 Tax=Romanomermis culicivorax TaxID=13658 RepID=A0A915I950_ROMCU
MMRGSWLHNKLKVENGMDIRMCREVGTDNTLVIAVIIEDDAYEHMFTESGFHASTSERVLSASIPATNKWNIFEGVLVYGNPKVFYGAPRQNKK